MRVVLTVAMMVSAAAPAFARPACPASSPMQMDIIVSTIVASRDCLAAYRIMEACQFGSSADVQSGSAVVDKCEPGIGPRHRQAFERERKACVAKYAHEDGTMYRSMAAFCVAKAAVRYHRLSGGR